MQTLARFVRSWQGKVAAALGILAAALTLGANAAQLYDVACGRLIRCATPVPAPLPTAPLPQLSITRIEYRPAGDPVAGEYVEIANQGPASADFTGWTLCDRQSHCYAFPTFVLAPGGSVKVWSGEGTNTDTDLYWGSRTAIWNNEGGDTAYVRDASQALVCQREY